MKFTKLISTFVILLVLNQSFISCKKEDKETKNKYEKFLIEAHNKGMLNGNVLIYEKGEIVYQNAFGISNIQNKKALDLNSQFRLASVSKQFTAMAIMKLKESGKLTYDQNVNNFIPELPYKNITIRHLLNHVSGIADYEKLMLENWKTDLSNDSHDKEVSGNIDIINMLKDKKPPMLFQPGEEWQYSNTGYLLLATIVERVSGQSFPEYLKEQIFIPLKMNSTLVYNYKPTFDEAMPNRVFGYEIDINGRDLISNDYHYLNHVQGDGGIYATVGDLLKWDRALYKEELVTKKSLEEAFTPAKLTNGEETKYGFGWFLNTSPSSKKVVDHSGSWVGFRTYMYREIEGDNCIIILTNNSSSYLRDIVEAIIKMLHNQPYSMPRLSINDAMGEVILNKGIDEALQHYQNLKTQNSGEYNFAENQLNRLGYQLISLGNLDAAVKVLKLNTEQYPKSANTFDSYADALLANKDSINALMNFKKAFEMDSTFTFSLDKAKSIENTMINNANNK